MSQNDNISLDNRYIMWYNYNTLVWRFSVPIVQKIKKERGIPDAQSEEYL